jgi:hypothetical protein
MTTDVGEIATVGAASTVTEVEVVGCAVLALASVTVTVSSQAEVVPLGV